MTLVEFIAAGGAIELVVGSWTAGALSVGGWAYRRGLSEGRAEAREATVLPAQNSKRTRTDG